MPRPTRRMPRIHPLVPALVAVLAVAAALLVVAARDDGEAAPATTTSTSTTAPATTSTTEPEPVEPVPVSSLLVEPLAVEPPLAYRITYEVVENGLPRTEEWTVRRPYESLVISTRDGAVLTGTSTSRATLQTFLSNAGGWLPIQPELHRAAFDQHPAGAVAAMEVLGLVERVGEDEHLGRACSAFRTGQPLSTGDPTPPSEDEHTDFCIDEAGLVLHERWLIGGSVVVERTAVDLDLAPDLDDATFEPGPVADDAEELARAFQTIAVPADAETLERLRTDLPVPEGYQDDGAVFRAAGGGLSSGGPPGSAEIVRFYSSGPALLEVAEVYVDGPAPIESAAGAPVAVEGWDSVWFEPGFRTSSLRVQLGEGYYVELRHHDVAFLFDVLATMARRSG
jgi:hypothetical protein